jgi:hypothetical protein
MIIAADSVVIAVTFGYTFSVWLLLLFFKLFPVPPRFNIWGKNLTTFF